MKKINRIEPELARMRNWTVGLLGTMLFLLFGCGHPAAIEPDQYVEGKILVKPKPEVQFSQFEALLDEFDLTMEDWFEGLGVSVVWVPDGSETHWIARFETEPMVEWARRVGGNVSMR